MGVYKIRLRTKEAAANDKIQPKHCAKESLAKSKQSISDDAMGEWTNKEGGGRKTSRSRDQQINEGSPNGALKWGLKATQRTQPY